MQREILTIKTIELAGIPCLYVKPNLTFNKVPTVIYYHGWSSNKENNLFLGKILAFHGNGVILPDAIHHGERGSLENYNVEALRKYFWKVIFNSVNEYRSLTKDALEKLGIDPNTIAVMGSSMGGFIASGVFASNKEIKCLINMNGASAWEKAENVFKEIDKNGKGAADEQQMEQIQKIDPMANKESLYPRPMLLLHGDIDTSISIDIQRYFYNEMKELYKDKPDRIKFIETPRLNHYKTVGMMEESIAWLEKYL